VHVSADVLRIYKEEEQEGEEEVKTRVITMAHINPSTVIISIINLNFETKII